ncbi:MAG: 16S rRNA (cytosine(1402)-N(4))-methyltransferase RsmH [Rickettsiales bacterium]|nr:16S rRNA (cytosine(1402)-N(4))-methyltransferase RsmH [Rickettsiales bacterium]
MTEHAPVMLHEMIDWLNPKDSGTYIDGTFGAGGYSRAILSSANCRVFAIDRDPSTRRFAEKLEQEFPGRFIWLLGNFSDMCSLVAIHGVRMVDGIVLDLGVSSMQLDQADRGFSFRQDGPLDMRMSQQGISVADIVNQLDERELADILYQFGEEKQSRRIAKAIIAARGTAPIATTRQLAEIIRSTLGIKPGSKVDPATRSFQALRIHVNQELDSIEGGLKEAETLLAPGGKLVVVTFHSLEDRIAKQFIYSRCGRSGEPSRHMPQQHGQEAPAFFMPQPAKKKASALEVEHNPRSRSATMRMMERAALETQS